MASTSDTRALDSAVSQLGQNVLSWLPDVSLICAFGLLLIAIGDARSRASLPDAPLFFWAGLLTLLIPMIVLGSSEKDICETHRPGRRL